MPVAVAVAVAAAMTVAVAAVAVAVPMVETARCDARRAPVSRRRGYTHTRTSTHAPCIMMRLTMLTAMPTPATISSISTSVITAGTAHASARSPQGGTHTHPAAQQSAGSHP